ncbi:hypothetical protein [Salinigranum salinum]|uniref:hypothetical protein n=1 Tax=Salinigranum salinum TaxID=1364937 RepID=UPI0012607C47|nr:hypothetical protein [Salinigranum salinum]
MSRASGDRDDDPAAGADRRRFAAALARLSPEAFAAFVADLWRARGRTVERDGTTLTTDGEGRGRRRLVVTHGDPEAVTAPTDNGGVVDGSDADADAGDATPVPTRIVTSQRVERAGETHPSDDRVVDADELLQTVRYAVDRARASTVLERHLGDGAGAFASVGATPDGLPHRTRPLSAVRDRLEGATGVGHLRPHTRIALVLLLVVCVAAAAVVGAVPALRTLGAGGTASPADATASPAPVGSLETTRPPTPTPPPTPTLTPVDYAALDCPRPPAGDHPVQLRPGVVPGASSSGLDGWEIRSAENVTTFEDRAALGLPTEPLVRHLVRYASPDGTQFDLALDRWASPRAAASVGAALAADSDATVRWGAYTATVRTFDANGTRVATDTRTGRVEILLSYVHRPSGIRLGDSCVQSLLAATENG